MNRHCRIGVCAGLSLWVLWLGAAAVAAEPAPVQRDGRPAMADPLEGQPGIVRVYENKFDAKPGPEWSHRMIGQTPLGNHHYLGGFVEQPVELKLANLPQHRLLRVSFDLYLMRAWDGSSPFWGEKIWDMDVVGGQRLIHTTFSNTGFFTDNNLQAFPETYPCRAYPAWTGAAEKQTLGVIQSWGGPDRTFDTSSWYHMSLAFPHSEASVALHFKATLRNSTDKSWGIGNMRVEAVPELLKLNQQGLTERFAQLGANDPMDAFKALWELVAAGDDTVAYLAQRWQESAEPKDAQLRAWVKQCAGDDVALANRAAWSLMTSGLAGYPPLSEALEAGGMSEAAKERCQETRFWIDIYPETATELRQHRLHHLLKAIGTPAALKLTAQVPVHTASDKSAVAMNRPAQASPSPEGAIQLDVRDEPADVVFDKLGKQSGVKFDASDPGIWENARPITLQTRNGWFWPTLLEVCRQSGVGFQAPQGPDLLSIRLMGPDSAGSVTRFPSAQSHGFVILATGASRSYSVDYAQQNARQHNQALSLMLLADPGVSVAQVSPLTISQATDSKGGDIWAGARTVAMPFNSIGTGTYMSVLMSNAARDIPQTLSCLNVECIASVVAGMERLEIVNPLTAATVRKPLAMGDLLVQPLTEQSKDGRTQYVARLTLRLKEAAGRDTMRGDRSTLAESATLTDVKGHRYSRLNADCSGSNLVREQVVRFINPDPATIGAPASLCVELPTATRPIPLTFELKDLMLP